MAFRIPARVKATSTTTGSGAITLIAAGANLRTWAAAFGASSRRVFYAISGPTYYEIGVGTFDGANSLARNTVFASSNGGALVSLPVGTHDVFAWTPGGNAVRQVASGDVSLTLADLGETIVWRGSSAGTVSLPDTATAPDFVRFEILNIGTAVLTLDPFGSQEINDLTTLALRPGEGVSVTVDPAGEWYAHRSALGDGAVLGANVFNGLQSVVVSSGDALRLTSTDAGAGEGPNLPLFRDSASPAANDVLGALDFEGRSSTAVQREFAKIRARVLDVTNASEDAVLELFSIVAGALAVRASLGQGLFMAGATGGDQGAGTINAVDYRLNGSPLPIRRFLGSWQSITFGGTLTQAHGLSVTPDTDRLFCLLRNNSGGSISGWPNLAVVPGPNLIYPDSGSWGAFLYTDDATNIRALIGASGLTLGVKGGGGVFYPLSGQWQMALGCYY